LLDEPAAVAQLTAAVAAASAPTDRTALLAHPLASWIESTLGVRVDDDGRLVRTRPEPLGSPDGASRRLAELTGQPIDACERAIRAFLLTGADLRAFGFRLHQFVSRGEAVFASPEPEATRYITLQAQEFVPDSDRHKRLLPVAFCRECGQEYYVVRRTRDDDGRVVYRERDVAEKVDPDKEGGDEGGFLYLSTDDPWPADDPDALLNRVPESWLEVTAKGVVRASARATRPCRARSTCRPMASRAEGTSRPPGSPRRSCTACAAVSPTTRTRPRTSASSPRWAPKGAAPRPRSWRCRPCASSAATRTSTPRRASS
jgi:hypothetical protein